MTFTIYHDEQHDWFELHPPTGAPIQLPTLAGAVAMAYLLAVDGVDIELVSTDEDAHDALAALVAAADARADRRRDELEVTRLAVFYGPGAYGREASRDSRGQYRGRGEW
jgi:hypothetical protein